MKHTPSVSAISIMIVAMVVIAFIAWTVLKHIVREQPATTEHPAMPKQPSIQKGGPLNGLTVAAER